MNSFPRAQPNSNHRPDSSAVRLSRPGEIALQVKIRFLPNFYFNNFKAGRKVRPPGERDERLVNPRLRDLHAYSPEETDYESSYYAASYGSSYELSEDEQEGSSEENNIESWSFSYSF